jgi:hypothetical protein
MDDLLDADLQRQCEILDVICSDAPTLAASEAVWEFDMLGDEYCKLTEATARGSALVVKTCPQGDSIRRHFS